MLESTGQAPNAPLRSVPRSAPRSLRKRLRSVGEPPGQKRPRCCGKDRVFGRAYPVNPRGRVRRSGRGVVLGRERQTFSERLGDQDAVERILVKVGQAGRGGTWAVRMARTRSLGPIHIFPTRGADRRSKTQACGLEDQLPEVRHTGGKGRLASASRAARPSASGSESAQRKRMGIGEDLHGPSIQFSASSSVIGCHQSSPGAE